MQEIDKLNQVKQEGHQIVKTEPKDNENQTQNRVMVQVQQQAVQQQQPQQQQLQLQQPQQHYQVPQRQNTISAGTKLILIHQPNGQLIAVPASQISGGGSIKIPPRASSAPPTEPFKTNSWTHPTRPASVDAIGILKGTNTTSGSQSNSLRASPAPTQRVYCTTPTPLPPATPPPSYSVAATPPMPLLEPNESLSIRASIDSSDASETPQLTEEMPSQNGIHSFEVDENMKPSLQKVITVLPEQTQQITINTSNAGPSMGPIFATQNGVGSGQVSLNAHGHGQQISIQQQPNNAQLLQTNQTNMAGQTTTKVIKKVTGGQAVTVVTHGQGSNQKTVLLKPYGVPLLPKPPPGGAHAHINGQNSMACDVKAMVVCKQCGKYCHNDCISSSNVCVSCLIR